MTTINWTQAETQWRRMALLIESQWEPHDDDLAPDDTRMTRVFTEVARVVQYLSRRVRDRSY